MSERVDVLEVAFLLMLLKYFRSYFEIQFQCHYTKTLERLGSRATIRDCIEFTGVLESDVNSMQVCS